jgi:phosphomannomutase/phosphoglucomutase
MTEPVTKLESSIFRMYDVRGIVDIALTEETVYLIGKAIGSSLIEQHERKIVIGRDGRLSGERLSQALLKGLVSTGIQVVDLGQVATPMVYFAAMTLPDTESCAVITGSHNPSNYNGIKIVAKGLTLYGEHIQALLKRIQNHDFVEQNPPGLVDFYDVFPAYQARIVSDIELQKPLKVVVDSGNGVAGAFGPKILGALGCEVIELYSGVDGTFPNHHPDPAKLKNLESLILKVKQTHADLGIAFDGDGDRCGIVDNLGRVLYPDRQLMLYAQDVLKRQPGAEIIYDIKSTSLLPKQIEQAGGKATLWKTGHSFMKLKMRETGAALGGEVSGHMFFKERWYGFDDGIYTAARMLEILSQSSQTAAELFDALPDAYNTPEIDIEFAEGEHYAFFNQFKAKASFEQAQVFDLDGVRVNFADGWGLLRPSNTSPVIVLRFEGDSPQALNRIQNLFKQKILAINPQLKLPF